MNGRHGQTFGDLLKNPELALFSVFIEEKREPLAYLDAIAKVYMRVEDARPVPCEHIRIVETGISMVERLRDDELLYSLGGRMRKKIAAEVHEIGAIKSIEQHERGASQV